MFHVTDCQPVNSGDASDRQHPFWSGGRPTPSDVHGDHLALALHVYRPRWSAGLIGEAGNGTSRLLQEATLSARHRRTRGEVLLDRERPVMTPAPLTCSSVRTNRYGRRTSDRAELRSWITRIAP